MHVAHAFRYCAGHAQAMVITVIAIMQMNVTDMFTTHNAAEFQAEKHTQAPTATNSQ